MCVFRKRLNSRRNSEADGLTDPNKLNKVFFMTGCAHDPSVALHIGSHYAGSYFTQPTGTRRTTPRSTQNDQMAAEHRVRCSQEEICSQEPTGKALQIVAHGCPTRRMRARPDSDKSVQQSGPLLGRAAGIWQPDAGLFALHVCV